MNVTILDHLLALALLLPLPLLGGWQLRRLKARLAAGEPEVRVRQYRIVLLEEFVLAGAVFALWVAFDRPWEALAPATPAPWDWLPWAGWAAAVAFCLLLGWQTRSLLQNEGQLADARRQLEHVAAFLPHTERELGTFRALSVAAGVGEEIVFRGFTMAYLAAVASALGLGGGAALGVAALGSSVMFGLAHAYQGPAGMARTGAVGLVLAGLAVATGGLLAPMLVHTVVDLTSGQVAHRAMSGGPPADAEPAAA